MIDCFLSSHAANYRYADLKSNRHPDFLFRHAHHVEKEDLSTPGKRARHARKLAKLNQTELAKKVGITQSSVSDIERGETLEISGPVLVGISQACGVRPEWIVTGKGQKLYIEAEKLNPTPDEVALIMKYRDPQLHPILRAAARIKPPPAQAEKAKLQAPEENPQRRKGTS